MARVVHARQVLYQLSYIPSSILFLLHPQLYFIFLRCFACIYLSVHTGFKNVLYLLRLELKTAVSNYMET